MSKKTGQGQLFWGLLLIIIGVLFLFEQLGYIDFGEVISKYWPAIFIIIGISIYIANGFNPSGSALFFILLGVLMMLIKLKIIERDLWPYLWPILLIVLGIWIIFKPRTKPSS
jgi:lia operon protein LiaF